MVCARLPISHARFWPRQLSFSPLSAMADAIYAKNTHVSSHADRAPVEQLIDQMIVNTEEHGTKHSSAVVRLMLRSRLALVAADQREANQHADAITDAHRHDR